MVKRNPVFKKKLAKYYPEISIANTVFNLKSGDLNHFEV